VRRGLFLSLTSIDNQLISGTIGIREGEDSVISDFVILLVPIIVVLLAAPGLKGMLIDRNL
jgi:hypothetical protein